MTTASIYFINNGFKNKKRKFFEKNLKDKQMFGKIFLNKKGDDNIE